MSSPHSTGSFLRTAALAVHPHIGAHDSAIASIKLKHVDLLNHCLQEGTTIGYRLNSGPLRRVAVVECGS